MLLLVVFIAFIEISHSFVSLFLRGAKKLIKSFCAFWPGQCLMTSVQMSVNIETCLNKRSTMRKILGYNKYGMWYE